MITGKTKLLGIIGYPLDHSLSPVMQNAALAHLGIDYRYVPFLIQPKKKKLKEAISGLTAIDNLVGFNVTIPHKEAIIPFLSEISATARAVGAVNTVLRTEAGWSGDNTDVEGFLTPLKNLTVAKVGENDSSVRDWSSTVAVILGYGGAARAVVAGCAQLGCAEIRIVGRDPKKLKHFLKSWRKSDWKMNLSGHLWEELPPDLISQAGLLVNATPVGQKLDVQESPLSAEQMTQLGSDAIAYDLIYNPNPTLLLQQAQAQGAIAIDGLDMLVQQGAAALKFWLQHEEVPVEVMRQSLRQHLGLPT